MTALKAFYTALNEQELAIAAPLSQDNLGIALRAAINELDWYFYNYRRSKDPTEEQQEQLYILQLGVTRLISLALNARPAYDVPVIMFQRSSDITLEVLSAASAVGMIQHGRRVAQSVTSGLGSIEQLGPTNFVVTLRPDIRDDHYFERTILDHFTSRSRRGLAALTASSSAFRGIEQDVSKKLTELVFPYERHFIGYGADPLLDEYFFGLAYFELQLHEGFDTFHYTTRFGGIRFQAYILALTFLISTVLRHERFAEALVAKDGSIRLENVLTISAETAPFAESVRDAVNHFGRVYEDFEEISLDQARTILDALSIRRSNTALIDPPGSALPLLVQSSDAAVIKCIAGAQSEPVRFLLDSLRHHYQREYDINQQTREKAFQSALERVFSEAIGNLQYRRNVSIKQGGRVLTDIDSAIIEPMTGVVVLCQVKHQELYGANLHAKRVRADRLYSQSEDWLLAVRNWTAAAGDVGLKERLQLPETFPAISVFYLIVTRHFAYPLRPLANDTHTAYGTWPQILNAIAAVSQDPSSTGLEAVVKTLKEYQAYPEPTHLDEPSTEWIVGPLRFEVRQADRSDTPIGT